MASCYTFGQTLVTDIKTPMNSPVPHTYELGDGMTSTDKANLSDSVAIRYPNATEVNPPSATYHYNCHSFAWYRSEGGNRNVWIGWTGGGTAEDIYWDDGSFIKVSSLSDATKISYDNDGTGDHSAIKLSGTNCRSKWGAWPLVDHAVGYGPDIYNMSIREYYAPFKVNGPQLVCSGSTTTFTTPDYVDCTFNWTYNTNLLDYVSGQGTKTFVVEPKYSYSQGQAWVKLELTIDLDPDVTREITKIVWVGAPKIDYISGPTYAPNNDWATYYAQPNNSQMAATDYEWALSPTNGNVIYDYGWTADIAFYNAGNYQLVARAQNTCGWGPYTVLGLEVYDSKSLAISPNPTTGETTITIKPASEKELLVSAWDLEIYTPTQALKEKKTRLKGSSTVINTAGWQEGVYVVRVLYNNEIITGKLIVKR